MSFEPNDTDPRSTADIGQPTRNAPGRSLADVVGALKPRHQTIVAAHDWNCRLLGRWISDASRPLSAASRSTPRVLWRQPTRAHLTLRTPWPAGSITKSLVWADAGDWEPLRLAQDQESPCHDETGRGRRGPCARSTLSGAPSNSKFAFRDSSRANQVK
jgi:hypothetical protein